MKLQQMDESGAIGSPVPCGKYVSGPFNNVVKKRKPMVNASLLPNHTLGLNVWSLHNRNCTDAFAWKAGDLG